MDRVVIVRHQFDTWVFLPLFVGIFVPEYLLAQGKEAAPAELEQDKATLVQAVMCEEIKNGVPQNPAIAFSVSPGRVYCFTSFDPVTAKNFIYHRWFYRDWLSTKMKLDINPPRWSTYSSIGSVELIRTCFFGQGE